MSEAEEEEDAIGGTCECEEVIETLVGSEGKRHKNGNGSFIPRGGCSRIRTDTACVAGGDHHASLEILNSAEKYNPENKSWEPLPNMNRGRRFCLGFYMDSKFYVIGGRNENYKLLFCGECYDFELNVWKLIPNMIEVYMAIDIECLSDHMVVVNNELYYLEFPSRHLKVYLKNNNTWKKVGTVPASIEFYESWGVSLLKSLGNELLLIGTTYPNLHTPKSILCFCTPSPELDDVE